MKKIILLVLLIIGCSTKKITYKMTYNDDEYIRVKYIEATCPKIGDVSFISDNRYEVIACEEAR